MTNSDSHPLDLLTQAMELEARRHPKRSVRLDPALAQAFFTDAPANPAPVAAPARPAAPLSAQPPQAPARPAAAASPAPLAASVPTPAAPAAPAVPAAPAPAHPPLTRPAAPGPGMSPAIAQETLPGRLRELTHDCPFCQLTVRDRRSSAQFAAEKPRLMVITDSPPPYLPEMYANPVIGQEGELMLAMVKALGVQPDELYVCQTHRCAASVSGFGLDPGQMAAFREKQRQILSRQIQILQPAAILIFSAVALERLCGERDLLAARHRRFSIGGIPIVATVSPHYILNMQRQSKEKWMEARRHAWEDLQRLKPALGLV